MEQTYCKKNCGQCGYKAELNCPGCKEGPGRPVMGQCEIARCVQEKGYENCDKCGYMTNCFRRTSRVDTPAVLRGNRSAFLSKWMMVLFLLFIPNRIGNFLTEDFVVSAAPGLYFVGEIIVIVSRIAYGAVLLKMNRVAQGYSTAGVCTILTMVIYGLVTFLVGTAEPPVWAALLIFVSAIVGLVAEYHEYMGHATVLYGVNQELSGKWRTLWSWNIGLFVGVWVCTVLAVLIPLLGALGLLGSAIGLLVVSIMKLVYLWQSAQYFKTYRA